MLISFIIEIESGIEGFGSTWAITENRSTMMGNSGEWYRRVTEIYGHLFAYWWNNKGISAFLALSLSFPLYCTKPPTVVSLLLARSRIIPHQWLLHASLLLTFKSSECRMISALRSPLRNTYTVDSHCSLCPQRPLLSFAILGGGATIIIHWPWIYLSCQTMSVHLDIIAFFFHPLSPHGFFHICLICCLICCVKTITLAITWMRCWS